MSSSARPTVVKKPPAAHGTTVASPAPGAPSAMPVELVRHTLSEDPELLHFLRGRARLFSVINLCACAFLLAREWLTARDPHAGTRIGVFATALAVQVFLVLAARTAHVDSVRGYSRLGMACATVFASVCAALQFSALRQPDVTARVFGPDFRSSVGVHYANGWALMWFAIIFLDAAVYPRTARRTLAFGAVMGIVAAGVCLAAYAGNGTLTPADLGVLLVQTAFWVVIGTALGVICQYRLESLQYEADKAKRFGQYRLTRRLDAGGMGEVYLAEHLLLKRPSVIKMVRADRSTDPGLLARFEREVKMLATLTHPNTVAVFDYGHTADGTFYYVMEYLPGLDLDNLVAAGGPLPPGRVVHLLRQVCGALREAHASGLIHRDVKPKNVMACERGGVPDVAKLLDFGLVQVDVGGSEKLTGGGTVMGTPAYMSPEQAAGLPTDHRSDIYSLGATAYTLLTGRVPFERPTVMLTLTAHITDEPEPLDKTAPADLAAVVMRCLAKKPEDRFADVRELEAELAACDCAADWRESDAANWWARHRLAPE